MEAEGVGGPGIQSGRQRCQGVYGRPSYSVCAPGAGRVFLTCSTNSRGGRTDPSHGGSRAFSSDCSCSYADSNTCTRSCPNAGRQQDILRLSEPERAVCEDDLASMMYPREVKSIQVAVGVQSVDESHEEKDPLADDCLECYVLRDEPLPEPDRRFESFRRWTESKRDDGLLFVHWLPWTNLS